MAMAVCRASLRACCIVCGLLFSVTPVAAAGLVGVVRRDSRPLAGVEVKLLNNGRLVTDGRTDPSGRYLLRNLQPGVYDLQCGAASPFQVRIRDGVNQINCNG